MIIELRVYNWDIKSFKENISEILEPFRVDIDLIKRILSIRSYDSWFAFYFIVRNSWFIYYWYNPIKDYIDNRNSIAIKYSNKKFIYLWYR